jgi:peptidoglycan/xylan/chitin deacetylase (PgdA/CDA1 family)
MSAIPILLYHSVSREPSALIRPFTVTPEVFGSHMDCVIEQGRVSLTVSELAAALEGTIPLPERPVVVTFDDGFADFQEVALPALRARGLGVTLYVTTGFLRGSRGAAHSPGFEDRMLAWSQLPELATEGVELGGHSHTHPHLDTLSPAQARVEIMRCKTLLEERLGTPVRSFAYPNGYSSRTVRRLVREAGYRSACSVKDQLSSPDDDVFSLARLMVRADTSLAELRTWLAGAGPPIAPTRERLRTKAWRLHRRMRALATGRPGSDIH